MNKKLLILLVLVVGSFFAFNAMAAEPAVVDEAGDVVSTGIHQLLKEKFIEGTPAFMSLVAISLLLGLAFCIERIVYLGLAKINTRAFMASLDNKISAGEIEEAKNLARNTRGPVASICYQGLLRVNDPIESIEHSVENYANLQLSSLEKGFSWIKLFIAIAPSLGFLGTVIGMVMSFDNIQMQGDISPTIVAGGMKVALITTIFGIVSAVILQLFFNYILTRVEKLTADMEEAGITLLDSLSKYKQK